MLKSFKRRKRKKPRKRLNGLPRKLKKTSQRHQGKVTIKPMQLCNRGEPFLPTTNNNLHNTTPSILQAKWRTKLQLFRHRTPRPQLLRQ